jgi:hypothetical protein
VGPSVSWAAPILPAARPEIPSAMPAANIQPDRKLHRPGDLVLPVVSLCHLSRWGGGRSPLPVPLSPGVRPGSRLGWGGGKAGKKSQRDGQQRPARATSAPIGGWVGHSSLFVCSVPGGLPGCRAVVAAGLPTAPTAATEKARGGATRRTKSTRDENNPLLDLGLARRKVGN